MSGYIHKVRDWWNRAERKAADEMNEYRSLTEELRGLMNEARYQSEESFTADLARKRDILEKETRLLFYAMQEPQRSMLQGRCQRLIEEIERPDAVQARIAEVNIRLRELEAEASSPADEGNTVEGDATH